MLVKQLLRSNRRYQPARSNLCADRLNFLCGYGVFDEAFQQALTQRLS
jgi:hypothetical protein